MTDFRQQACGRQCQARIPGVCNFDSATTVLAHVRMAGITGMGQKADDRIAAWLCSSCHDCVDGRSKTDLGLASRRIALLEAVVRTQYQLIKEGKL